MKDTITITQKVKNIKGRLKSTFLALLHKFKDVKFIIILSLALFIANAFIVFRINYSENYAILYRYERPTVLLENNNYIELYKFHDYIEFKDKTVNSVLTANKETKFGDIQNIILGINNSTEEIAYGDKADIKTNINRINKQSFEIQREITFKNNDLISQIDIAYIEVILGGDNINFENNTSTVTIKNCEIKVTYPETLFTNYKKENKVITFGTKVNNNSNIKFNINFNINCD